MPARRVLRLLPSPRPLRIPFAQPKRRESKRLQRIGIATAATIIGIGLAASSMTLPFTGAMEDGTETLTGSAGASLEVKRAALARLRYPS